MGAEECILLLYTVFKLEKILKPAYWCLKEHFSTRPGTNISKTTIKQN